MLFRMSVVCALVSPSLGHRPERSHTSLESARASLYSPYRHDIRELFETIDNKTLQGESVEKCKLQAKNFMDLATSTQTENSSPTPRLIHTGMFLEAGGGTAKWQNAETKIRLGVLSILASQDLQDTQIYFWVDVDPTNELLQQSLGPILENDKFHNIISVRKFDPIAEFETMSKTMGPNVGKVLSEIYGSDLHLASKSDIFRSAILYNYGGLWVDTDVLMIHDILPLLGMDWAYLGQKDFINGAVLSVSKPNSPFMSAYLKTIVGHDDGSVKDRQVFKFGPTLLGQVHKKPIEDSSFYILPTCFFDGAWAGVENSVYWDDFFSKPATDEQMTYIEPNNPSKTAFMYHWHGRWDKQIVEGSASAKAERMYLDMLKLTL